MKRVLCLAIMAAACGGNGQNAALSKTFSYGAPQSPTSAESSAASSAQLSLSSAASFSTTPSVNAGAAVLDFAGSMADAALGAGAFGGVMPRGATTPSHALRAAASNTDFSTCATVAGNTVTFNNCTDGETGFSMTLNGTISSTAGAVTWDITGSFSGSQDNESFSISIHEGGTFTVTGTTVVGNATYDFGGSASAQGQSISFGLAAATVVNLTYQTAPQFCVTNGDVEVKRVWTNRPAGADPATLADVGVKINWTGCNTVTVAHSQ